MPTHYDQDGITVLHDDCLAALRADTLGYDYRLGYAPPAIADNSVDAVVTDPPYGLEFMGREWDGADGFRRSLNPADAGRDNPFGRASRTSPEYRAGHLFQQWCEAWAAECLRVLKPGGHMLAFGGTRTSHRLACAVEDAGFEIRDSLAWLYGSGFPKSLDVSKAIDKAAGADREIVGRHEQAKPGNARKARFADTADAGGSLPWQYDLTAPATDDARTWQGWGTALKPAFEPIVVARKPLVGTVASNVLAHGTGALNIDGCRIAAVGRPMRESLGDMPATGIYGEGLHGSRANGTTNQGRWPANVVLDEDQAAALDRQSGTLTSGANPTRRGSDKFRDTYGEFAGQEECVAHRGADTGGASRFFHVAAASPLDDLPARFLYTNKATSDERVKVNGVAHPTVKPLTLMRWLLRLVTPPGGLVLEPFAGSGTTVEACILEGFRCLAIERGAEYLPLISQRINRRLDPVTAVQAVAREDDTDVDLFSLMGAP